MEMKLSKNKKKYLLQNFHEKHLYPSYNRFYVEDQQESCTLYMYIPYGNVFRTGSSQVLWVKKNNFYVFSNDETEKYKILW